MPVRVIPRLDIKAPNLVKGIHLEGLRVIGDPSEHARRYFEEGADELHYQDIVASLYNRSSIVELVRKTAEQIFVPLMVGGGIRTLNDIHMLLRAGADKVCINTAAVESPDFITRAARAYGSQCIVIAVETLRSSDGRWAVFTNNGRQPTGLDAKEWALRAVQLGAGELLITSVNQEGTRSGFEIEFLKQVVQAVNVPVIAHGGAGTLDHVVDAARTGVSAVAVASLLHYRRQTVRQIKEHLLQNGFEARL
jgi:imidazole glycerol-phosphate synthase subunit HisF